MIASIRNGLARTPPSTPSSSVTLWPMREQADVLDDVLEPVEEEDHADQEQQMVVAGDHVLGAEIHQRADRAAIEPLQEHRVLARHAVRAASPASAPERQHRESNHDVRVSIYRSLR